MDNGSEGVKKVLCRTIVIKKEQMELDIRNEQKQLSLLLWTKPLRQIIVMAICVERQWLLQDAIVPKR